MILDLFPLNSVVFPHQKISLRIFEPRYLKLIDTCHKEARSFGVCFIKEGKEVGAPAIPYDIGTSVVIREFTRVHEDVFFIVVQGEKRFKILRFIQEQPHIKVEAEWIDGEIASFPGDYSTLRHILKDILTDECEIPEDNNELFGFLGKLLAVYTYEKQKVLELSYEKVVPALTSLLKSM